MGALRLFPLLALGVLVCGAALASPTDCAEGCEVPGASLAPAPLVSSDSPSPLPLVESLGLCVVGIVGVAAGVALARRAD